MKFKLVFDDMGKIVAGFLGEKAEHLDYALGFEAESREEAEQIVKNIMPDYYLGQYHIEESEVEYKHERSLY